MTPQRGARVWRWAAAAVVIAALAGGGAYLWRRAALPSPETPEYEQTSRAFYHGLAALEVGLLDDARQQFTRATEIVTKEPASWANLGLTQLRLGELDAAVAPIERALQLAPDNVDIALLAGRMEAARGRFDEAVARLRRAVALDARGLQSRFALAEELQRSGEAGGDAAAASLYDELMARAPANLAILLERARLAAKSGDAARLADSVTHITALSEGWPDIAQEQLRALQAASGAAQYPDAARATTLLRNVLARVPAFSESLAAVRTPAELIADPLPRFVALVPASARPAAADAGLSFTREPIAGAGVGPVAALLAVDASPAGPAAAAGVDIFAATADAVRRIGSNAPVASATTAGPAVVAAVDWNHDFRSDLVRASGAGVQLLLREAGEGFTDATQQAGDAGVAGSVSGLWPADVDMDGDVDLIVGMAAGPARVLRNNGDGTWRPLDTFAGVDGARAFAWADLDHDAAPDAAFIDGAGVLRVWRNRQAGRFAPVPAPEGLRALAAVAVADLDADGVNDLVTVGRDGTVERLTRRTERWEVVPLAAWSDAPAGPRRVLVADLDNNGALDVIVSAGGSSRVWLAGEAYALTPLAAAIDGDVWAVSDVNQDGTLDLLGLGAGAPMRWLTHGQRGYHWKTFRTRAQQNAGDQRVNSFGVGGEIEVKAGLLWQKQVLTGGVVHFGLGPRTAIDVARVVWPNGVPQAEFGIGVDDAFVAEQRLKGSCPWVFAYDGRQMTFVTDFLWRSPLGLRINAQDTAGVTQTEDWIRIPGEALAAKEGAYDVPITAELWETHFFDHVSLMVVDHPADADVYVDERFSAASPPALAVHALREPVPVSRAVDDAGHDVTSTVARRDGEYLATFERGAYQGIAKEHFVEFDLPPGLRRDVPLTLLAQGWIYPTDSSINMAVAQGHAAAPGGLALEALDASGAWRVAVRDLGFPAGKNKTMVIDLAPVRQARRLRLRTNLEIYWDRLAVAARADVPVRTTRLAAESAELRFRGFSRTSSPRGPAPEIPDYNHIENTAQRWRDLVGYHTRYGDVRELLQGVDDRYVIVNAGDEMRLRFAEQAAPPAGWRRDFVLVGDGWEKDGDFNTEHSQTVLPLPSHDRPGYWHEAPEEAGRETRGDTAPTELEDDPVYRKHPQDWERYHTRFVRPRAFIAGLRDR